MTSEGAERWRATLGVGTLLAVKLLLAAVAEAAPPDLCGYVELSTGEAHTCALRPDGMIACWGFNAFGEATPPEGTFLQISTGWDYNCGLRRDGTLACWGVNDSPRITPPTGSFSQ